MMSYDFENYENEAAKTNDMAPGDKMYATRNCYSGDVYINRAPEFSRARYSLGYDVVEIDHPMTADELINVFIEFDRNDNYDAHIDGAYYRRMSAAVSQTEKATPERPYLIGIDREDRVLARQCEEACEIGWDEGGNMISRSVYPIPGITEAWESNGIIVAGLVDHLMTAEELAGMISKARYTVLHACTPYENATYVVEGEYSETLYAEDAVAPVDIETEIEIVYDDIDGGEEYDADEDPDFDYTPDNECYSESAISTVAARHPEVNPLAFYFIGHGKHPTPEVLRRMGSNLYEFNSIRAEIKAEWERECSHRQIGWQIVDNAHGFVSIRIETDDDLSLWEIHFLDAVRRHVDPRYASEPLSQEDLQYAIDSANFFVGSILCDEYVSPWYADDKEECIGSTLAKQTPGYSEMMDRRRRYKLPA